MTLINSRTFLKCVTSMPEISIESLILSAEVHIGTSGGLTHTSTSDIRFSCIYLFSKSNIHVFVIVIAS